MFAFSPVESAGFLLLSRSSPCHKRQTLHCIVKAWVWRNSHQSLDTVLSVIWVTHLYMLWTDFPTALPTTGQPAPLTRCRSFPGADIGTTQGHSVAVEESIWAVQHGNHLSHMATKHLECGQHNWWTYLLIFKNLIDLKWNISRWVCLVATMMEAQMQGILFLYALKNERQYTEPMFVSLKSSYRTLEPFTKHRRRTAILWFLQFLENHHRK